MIGSLRTQTERTVLNPPPLCISTNERLRSHRLNLLERAVIVRYSSSEGTGASGVFQARHLDTFVVSDSVVAGFEIGTGESHRVRCSAETQGPTNMRGLIHHG